MTSLLDTSSEFCDWFNSLLLEPPPSAESLGTSTSSRRKALFEKATTKWLASYRGGEQPPPSLKQFPVQVDSFPCGSSTVRGLRATRTIGKGETIVHIPYHCFLTAESILGEHAPQLESDVRTIESRLDVAGVENVVTRSIPKASTILHSCELILSLFLVLERFGTPPLGSKFRRYVDALPSMLGVSTPEMLFLMECESCSPVYLSGDVDLQQYRDQNRHRLYSRDDLSVLLGSKVRLQKVARRVEKLFLRFDAIKKTYLSVPTGGGTPTWLQTAGAAITFPQWLWASHMVNSRTFMNRRPRWSNFPRRYEDGYDSPSSSSPSDDDGGSTSCDDDAMLRAVETAKEAFRSERRQTGGGSPNAGSLPSAPRVVLQRAEAVVADESIARMQKIGSSSAAAAAVDGTASSSSNSSSSSDDEDEDEPDLLTMVPFIDFFNHDSCGTTNFTFDKETCALTIKADRPILEGEQVYLKYNDMDHWRFAKYYGFVPDSIVVGRGANNTSGETSSAISMTDAYPIAVPLPPSLAGQNDVASIVAVTKSQLFEGAALKKHCYVTKRGPNQQLQSVLRLAFLGAQDLERYTAAYDRPPLSMRNEWHVYEYLKNELSLRKLELERNVKKHSKALQQGLTCRGLCAVAVRERDLQVVAEALSGAKKRFEDLCGILYFGSTTTETLRTHVIHDQFKKLKAMGHLPLSESEQKTAGLGMLPSLVPGARYSVPDYTDALFDRLQKRLERVQRSSTQQKHVDPDIAG